MGFYTYQNLFRANICSSYRTCFFLLFFLTTYLTQVSGKQALNENSSPLFFTLSFNVSDYNGFGVSCDGDNDGFIDLTINGGAAPFDILWSNGAVTEDINSIAAGNYVVTVIDAVQDTVVDSVLVTEPSLLEVAVTTVNNVTCNGFDDGSIDITASGGPEFFPSCGLQVKRVRIL
jgi:hypothetical protein